MKSTKINGKVTTDHPMHKLYESAIDILSKTIQAYNQAKVPLPQDFSLPIWMDGDPIVKVTIEIGAKTTADYAIFKAQNQGDTQ